jgi:hypothetical protein
MKNYKDKVTVRLESKYSQRESMSNSDRNIRRQEEREYQKFVKLVYSYLEKDWWDSVDGSIQNRLYNEWKHERLYVARQRGSIKDAFIRWVKIIRLEVKPNCSLYRDKIIDKLLQE